MNAADEQDKRYWGDAKSDYERHLSEFPSAPTWENLTEKQRCSLRWLAERRAERRHMKANTFHLRYSGNPHSRDAGNAALADFDRRTQERLTLEELAEESERHAERRRQFALRYGMSPERARARALTADRVGYSIPQQRIILENDIKAVQARLIALGYYDTKEDS